MHAIRITMDFHFVIIIYNHVGGKDEDGPKYYTDTYKQPVLIYTILKKHYKLNDI